MWQLAVFPTDLGWFGLLGSDAGIARLMIGQPAEDSVLRAFARDYADYLTSDWNPPLRRKLEQFAAGHPVAFSECRIEHHARTPFQLSVLEVTRKIGYGRTLSYGELAEAAGSPRAARAVGSVMASNTVPIIIPCHRVLAAGGKIGGFSAPQGIDLKQRMLALEAEAIAVSA